MLAIFGFRKNRSQTLSNQGPDPEAEVYGDGCHTVATAPTGLVTFSHNTHHTWFIFRKGLSLNIEHAASLRALHLSSIHFTSSHFLMIRLSYTL